MERERETERERQIDAERERDRERESERETNRRRERETERERASDERASTWAPVARLRDALKRARPKSKFLSSPHRARVVYTRPT